MRNVSAGTAWVMLRYAPRASACGAWACELCTPVRQVSGRRLAQTGVENVQGGVRWGARRRAGRPADDVCSQYGVPIHQITAGEQGI